EEQFREDEVPEEWTAMRRLVWEKSIWTMLQENHWLKHKERVTLDAYLANGMYSSSFPIVQVSILAFSYQDVSQELKNRIFGHICQAARVVRLANDLRTHEREAAQGRFNSVDLIVSGPSDRTLENAREAVHHLMEEEFEQLKKAIARERRTGITQPFLSPLNRQSLVTLLALIGLGAIYNLTLLVVILPRRPAWLTSGYISAIGDVLLVTGGVAVTGGPAGPLASPFFLAYFVVTVTTAVRFGGLAAIVAVLTIALSYTAVVYYGNAVLGTPLTLNDLTNLAMRTGFAALTRIFVGFT